MMNEKMRTFELDGKKRGVRLDTHTWQAVDQLATQAGSKWAALARQWAENDPKDAEENLTAVIRTGAMAGMLALQQNGGIATATATATKTPGILRIDWASQAARGDFLLDAKSAENLARTLEMAQVQALLMQCPEEEVQRCEKLKDLLAKLTLEHYNTPADQNTKGK